MADKKSAASGDTDFRRTWDKAEYAARAHEHETKQRDEAKARYEAKLSGKKYHAPRSTTPPDVRDTEARTRRFDVASMVGKTMLVPAGAAVGKRGRGAGFYCEACDLTFKDNLQWVEHHNSAQHLSATGQSGNVKRATVEEVRARLRLLLEKRKREKEEEVVNLGQRIAKAEEQEQIEREKKRTKRNEKRKRQRARANGEGG